MAAAAQGVLLHATPDLIDDLGPQPDHVEGIEHSDRVREAVADCVGVSAERIQRSMFHAVDEAVGLGSQPGLVDIPGAARDGIQPVADARQDRARRENRHARGGKLEGER